MSSLSYILVRRKLTNMKQNVYRLYSDDTEANKRVSQSNVLMEIVSIDLRGAVGLSLELNIDR